MTLPSRSLSACSSEPTRRSSSLHRWCSGGAVAAAKVVKVFAAKSSAPSRQPQPESRRCVGGDRGICELIPSQNRVACILEFIEGVNANGVQIAEPKGCAGSRYLGGRGK